MSLAFLRVSQGSSHASLFSSSFSPSFRNPTPSILVRDLERSISVVDSMGKRKERRLAAMSAAGRRVKLDLFAEPSGETGDTSLHEVGGDPDQDHHADVPISPSSGQRKENPLLLLGQYSDDELDEEANKRPKHASNESSSTGPDDQVQEPVDAVVETGSHTVNDMTGSNDQQEPDQMDTVKELDDNDVKESDVTPQAALHSEGDPQTQICIPEAASGVQVDGDITGGWKMVLHEQSNQYYYWNTVTGETSWEAPSVSALETQIAGEQNVSSVIEERAGSLADVHASTHLNTDSMAYAYVTDIDGISCINSISEHAAEYGSVLGIGKENSEAVHFAYDANQCLTHYNTAVAGLSYQGSSTLPDYGSSQQAKDVLSEQLTTPMEEHHVLSEDMDKHFAVPTESCERTDAHSARLVKYSESLLQRLKALDRSGHQFEGHEWIMKEIEIRQSDCNALSSYGSLLLPFWWHTETQLKQLESVISKEEAVLPVQLNDHKIEERSQHSSMRDEPPLLSTGAGSEVFEEEKTSVENNCSSPKSDATKIQIEDNNQMPDSEDGKTKSLPCESTDQQLGSEKEQEVPESGPSTLPLPLIPNAESHAEEDIDMDVEMEVDEEIPASQTAVHDLSSSECPPPELLIRPNPSSLEGLSFPLDDSSVPPPPDEEWIPPPPPDSELVPPPPPEEPPAPFLPPYADTVPCPSYHDQYNLGYTVPSYEYYAPAIGEATNGNYYVHNDGSNVVEPQPVPYYEPVVAGVFPEVAGDINPVEPVAYYGVSNATIPPVPVVSSIEASGFYVESGSISYHGSAAALDQTSSLGFSVDHGSSYFSEVNNEPDISGVAKESKIGSLQAPTIVSSAQAAGTTSVNGSTADALPSAVPKSQSKVVRSKKRTVAVAPTLRSNKKVSSLVDKWKAAKEELHGEEDEEPESAYEILEKKRQKEIEEWRARQIASGEAKDNANFLPLGGDWRERVKRKKALEAKAEAVQTSSAVLETEKKQPDLVELSKDLPSGWQAYWDESTKEVYYGNSTTSETTWTRPTR